MKKVIITRAVETLIAIFSSTAKLFLPAVHYYLGIFMPAKYQVYKDVEGNFRFRLRAANNEILAASQAYEQHASCLKGLRSVQKNCSSEVEDMTAEGACAVIPNPKYQVFYDQKCKFRFHLNASNGEIIAASEGYETKEGCLNGINAVKTSCSAEVEDLTIEKEPPKSAVEVAKPEPSKIMAATPTAKAEKDMPKAEIKPVPVETKNLAPSTATVGLAAPSRVAPKTVPAETADKSRIVFVGNKMPMDYVLAIITGLSANNVKEITLKARGKSITTAVDAAEITRHRFIKDLKVNKIQIGTEEMPPREGETRARMVSTIEIVLAKT